MCGPGTSEVRLHSETVVFYLPALQSHPSIELPITLFSESHLKVL